MRLNLLLQSPHYVRCQCEWRKDWHYAGDEMSYVCVLCACISHVNRYELIRFTITAISEFNCLGFRHSGFLRTNFISSRKNTEKLRYSVLIKQKWEVFTRKWIVLDSPYSWISNFVHIFANRWRYSTPKWICFCIQLSL